MANPQLIEYINKVKSQGFNEAAIKEVLNKNGWQPSDIDLAFLEINQTSILNKDVPMSPLMMANLQKAKIEQAAETIKTTNIEYNSPFSIGLSFVLLGSLFILINKIITDSHTFTADANGELIFDALLILPFLLVAFILHGSFTSSNKRFLILSQSYFLVSAFLLVRLLWHTSSYIMSTNATYGVYVVLILCIAVLTGIILFVQKYIKN